MAGGTEQAAIDPGVNNSSSFWWRLHQNHLGTGITGSTTCNMATSDDTCFYGLEVCATNSLGQKACHTFTQAEIDHHSSGTATVDEKRYFLQHSGQNFVL